MYGCSLRDILRTGRPYTVREALVMIRWLPESSATVAVYAARAAEADQEAMKAGKKRAKPELPQFDPRRWHEWDTDRYLAARLVNELALANYLTQVVNSATGKKPPEPVFVETPGAARPKKPSATGLARAAREQQLKQTKKK